MSDCVEGRKIKINLGRISNRLSKNREMRTFTHMDRICSVRLVSKPRNCFPFLVNPFTSAPEMTKIFSRGAPIGPPSSSLFSLGPVGVLKTIWGSRFLMLNSCMTPFWSHMATYKWKWKHLRKIEGCVLFFILRSLVSLTVKFWSIEKIYRRVQGGLSRFFATGSSPAVECLYSRVKLPYISVLWHQLDSSPHELDSIPSWLKRYCSE